MPDWAVQQLRVSLFSSAAVTLSEAHWKAITGQDEADNRIALPGGKQYSGKFLDAAFLLGFTGSRCDVVATTEEIVVEPDKEAKLPVFGEWKALSTTFAERLIPFVRDFEFPIIRIAFGAVVLMPAGSKEEAYKMLARYISSVKIDPVNMRELSFRVNWPRPSTAMQGLELNRITNWAAIYTTRGLMQVMGPEMVFGTAGPELHAARLEIDHNTSPTHKEPFEPGVRVPILEELIAMARDNVETGEHP